MLPLLRQAPGSEGNQETPGGGGEAPETPDVLSLQQQQSCEETLFIHCV